MIRDKLIRAIFLVITAPTRIKTKISSIYNPTGNSLSERINSQINMCMRIHHGEKFEQIKQFIENRRTNVYNRMINAAPVELVYGTHPENKINIKVARKPTKYSIIRKNKRNLPYKYRIDEFVYIFTALKGKNDKF